MSNPNGTGLPALDDLNQAGKRIQQLVEKIEAMPESDARMMLQDCLESVLSFYGQGLARILQIIEKTAGDDKKIRDALINDGGVSGLLLIHGLHPIPLETRLKEALEKVRPYMKSHGGDVELLTLENEFARLRLAGHCQTCPSSTVTLELAVRTAIEEACPDLAGFEVEGMPAGEAGSFEHAPHAAPAWAKIELPPLRENELSTVHLGTEPLVVCRVGEELYAYYDRCPACNMPLHLGKVERNILTCHLGHGYDVQKAGAGLDGKELHLDPLPLLSKDGEIKVALTHSTARAPAELSRV